MRNVILIPLALLAVIVGGVTLCAAAGWPLHPREMTVAAIASAIVCALALGPNVLMRRASQAAVAQAALVGTLVHLMGHAAVIGFVILARPGLDERFIWWFMPFYWATLAALAGVLVRLVRQAPVSSAPAGH